MRAPPANLDRESLEKELKERGQWENYNAIKHRVNNHYMVKHEQYGTPINFHMEPYHEEALMRMLCGYKRQIAIKGRQVYFTTFSVVLMFDWCVMHEDYSCTIHNMTEVDMYRTIKDKVHYIARNSPMIEGEFNPDKGLFKDGINFYNGSRILVTRSGRSHTSQFNLITEASWTAERDPDKFQEVYQGMINGSQFYVNWMETSPFGTANAFIEITKNSHQREMKKVLRSIDFAVLFIPWWKKPRNVASEKDTEITVITPEFEEYFEKVERETGASFSDRQKAFYIGKFDVESQGSWINQKAEHPSTLEEALTHHAEAYIMQAYMLKAKEEGRYLQYPLDSREPTAVCWDFGAGKSHTAFICVQRDRRNPELFVVVAAYQARQESLTHFVSVMQSMQFNIYQHIMPHDAAARNMVAAKLSGVMDTSITEAFDKMNIRNWLVVDKVQNKKAGFEASISFSGMCSFCELRAADAIKSLEGVQREYDDKHDMLFDILKKKGAASDFNHLYDCFETAARANLKGALLPTGREQDEVDLEALSPAFDGTYF